MIMPLLTAVIVIVIYLAFYLHDRAVLNGIAYKAAMQASQDEEEDKDLLSKKAGDIAIDSLEHRLLATRNVKVHATAGGGSIRVACEGEFVVPTAGITALILKKDMPVIKVEKSAEIRRPVKFIRNTRKIEDFVGRR